MVRSLLFVMVAAGATVAVAGADRHSPSPVGQRGEWRLIFSDGFEGASINESKWATCYWWDMEGCTNLGNKEMQWYLPRNVHVDGGQVRLRAQPESTKRPEAVYSYTSGLISTGRATYHSSAPVKFEFQYGYVEMRARIPAGRGLWPAFWMLPSSHDETPEIDIMEVLGHEPNVLYLNFHYRDRIGARNVGSEVSTDDLSAGWHVFALEWAPDHLRWYLDGVELWRYEDKRYIPKEPMYLLVNLAVGGEWPGAPDATTQLPADFAVDYVRVWQRLD